MVPNHPRYQLRHTRIFSFLFLLSVVIPVVKTDFSASLVSRLKPTNTRVSRPPGLRLHLSRITAPALPKQARYQLRYTRILNFFVLLSVVIPVVKTDFSASLALRLKPANDRVSRPPEIRLHLSRITAPALPNVARYRLRYTRK